MRVLIVYDSQYGNTEKVAAAVANGAADFARVTQVHPDDARAYDFEGVDVVFVGSPTQGGRPTKAIQEYLKRLPARALEGIRVAAFDTRYALNDHGFGLRWLMKTIGFASPVIEHELEEKWGQYASVPEGFIVKKEDGPLAEGELTRAQRWARSIARVTSLDLKARAYHDKLMAAM